MARTFGCHVYWQNMCYRNLADSVRYFSTVITSCQSSFITLKIEEAPVLVMIHGGGFLYGAGQMISTEALALVAFGKIILVTINYRLGAMGFLDSGKFVRFPATCFSVPLSDIPGHIHSDTIQCPHFLFLFFFTYTAILTN